MKDVYRTAGSLALLWTALLIAGPVFEELLFRGFMFRGIQASRLGSGGAMVITALTWAALHAGYDLWDLVVVLAGGLLLGVARVKSDSVYVTIGMHSLWNLIATIEVALLAA